MTGSQSATTNLELVERLNSFAGTRKDAENVETDSLAQRPALSDGNLVALLNTESRRDMGRDVLVALLVTVVLGDVVEVVAADDEGAVHLGGDDGTSQDTSTDGDETSEGTLLVDEDALNGSLGGLETQTDILVPPPSTLSDSALRGADLLGRKDVGLFLESTLRLDGKLGSHGCVGCQS